MPDKDRRIYERYMESVRHMRSLFDTSHDDGYNEGRALGRAEGLEEGIAKGMEEGMAKGRAEERLKLAKSMLAQGIPAETVAEITALAVDDILS